MEIGPIRRIGRESPPEIRSLGLEDPDARPLQSKAMGPRRKTVVRVAGIYLLAVLVLLAALALWPRRTLFKPLPVPNGYDDLLRAAALVPRDSFDRDKAKIEDLRARVERYREALKIAREGLRKECRVPVDFSKDHRLKNYKRYMAIRRLISLFEDEECLAEREGKIDAAARCCLDIIRIAAEAQRGGVVEDINLSRWLNYRGISCFSALRSKISPQALRDLVRILVEIDENKEPVEDIYAREHEWEEKVYGTLTTMALRTMMREMWTSSIEAARYLSRKNHTSLRLLMVDLSIRAFRFRRDRLPRDLDDLTPVFLDSIPLDPFSGKPFIFRIEDDDFVLYSIGRDGKDDGGSKEKDFFLDSR